MVQSLIQRIRENKLDALYLFINESLRDRNEFDVFFHNLMIVLPNNWSINRVEIGHEFLSRTVVGDQQQAGQPQEADGNENIDIDNHGSKQDQLFRWVCSLESLRSLIISDGYIPRKDHGFVDTRALLRNLPRANNLQYLDIQRLKLRITGDNIENNDAELLAESLDSLRDSLEDLRLTAISMCDTTRSTDQESNTIGEEQQQSSGHNRFQCAMEQHQKRYPLDATIRVCGEMSNLQLLAVSCANSCECHDDNGEDQQNPEGDEIRLDRIRELGNEIDGSDSPTSDNKSPIKTSCLISREVLLLLCRSSSTLQELALRSMRIDDDTCKTIAKAFDPPDNSKALSLSLECSDGEQDNDNDFHENAICVDDTVNNHSPSFWTSLDLRQNPSIGTSGYEAILSSLERNYDLWCSLMVDNDSFQSRFNALIELNQANRGSLVRSPTPEKLAVFLDRLKDDPTALWYFLTIHRDSILHPLIRYLKWKNTMKKNRIEKNRGDAGRQQQQQQQQQVVQEFKQSDELGHKRRAAVALSLPTFSSPIATNGTPASSTDDDKFANTDNPRPIKDADPSYKSQEPHMKRSRQSTGETNHPR